MSTLTVYPDANPESTSFDGRVLYGLDNSTWNDLVVAASGNGATDTDTIAHGFSFTSGTNSNTWYQIGRGWFLFDTSALGSTANISAATLSLYGASQNDLLSAAPDINIYSATTASNTAASNSDYGGCGATALCDTAVTYAGWNMSGYNNFALNASGKANISKNGISKFSSRNANYDLANSPPPWLSGNKISNCYCHHADGTTGDPKLVITYTTPSGPANMKTLNNVAAASIKTINGVAIASVKTWNGIP